VLNLLYRPIYRTMRSTTRTKTIGHMIYFTFLSIPRWTTYYVKPFGRMTTRHSAHFGCSQTVIADHRLTESRQGKACPTYSSYVVCTWSHGYWNSPPYGCLIPIDSTALSRALVTPSSKFDFFVVPVPAADRRLRLKTQAVQCLGRGRVICDVFPSRCNLF
jgi:hypothetical protein